jgi:4-amino-4-deoxy-L-arabinose transferase-like glycosyltransferase
LRKKNIILWTILILALLLRLGHWLAVRDQPFFAQLIMDSHEYDRWAQEIAGGAWLGSEVFFQAPLYPYLLAVLYSIFGHHLDVVYVLQILLAVAGCYALFKAGEKIGGEKVGLASAALAALYGVFIFYDVQVLKESLAVVTVCFLLWILVEARESQKMEHWFTAGLLCGMLSLLRENMLIVVLFLLFLPYCRNKRLVFFLSRSAALLLGVCLIITPVAVRNWVVGKVFLPTTFQGGVNFYIGNNPLANGTYQPIVPGKQIPSYERAEPIRIAEQDVGRKLSPGEVSDYWFRKSLSWIKRDPLGFVRLQLRKLMMFWSWYEWPDAVDYYYTKTLSPVLKLPLFEFGGVFILMVTGIWMFRRKLAVFAPVWLFALAWMISTVIFFLFSRYRLPCVPALILLAAIPVATLYEDWRERKRKRGIALAALFVFALVMPRLVGYPPREDLVHYNLALVYEDLDKLQKASYHYREAISINPNDFLSCINLGNLRARRNDWSQALLWYHKALSIEPRSEGAHLNLGNAYIALGLLDKAEHHLSQALELNPKNKEALHSQSVLLAKKGDLEGALKVNRAVLKLVPGWTPALRFREKLENLVKKK